MGATAEALAKAAERYPDLRPYLPGGSSLPDVRNLEQFLAQLELAETEARNGFNKLVAAADSFIDRREDYLIYAELQNSIYKAELSAIRLVVAVAGPVNGALLLPLLEPPMPMPLLTWGERHASQLRGLGVAPALAIAGVIASALAALGLLYLYSEEISHIVDDLTTVYVARARAAQQTELIEARRSAFEACLGRGGDAETCRAEVVDLVPTPRAAGTDIDGPGERRPGWTAGQIGLAVAGVVVVVAIGGGLFFVAREGMRGGGGFAGYSDVPVRKVGPLPRRVADLDSTQSRYNLEVRGVGRVKRSRKRRT